MFLENHHIFDNAIISNSAMLCKISNNEVHDAI